MLFRSGSARAWAAVAICAWLLGGCGSTGGITVADEQEAGAQAAQQVADQVGMYPGEFVTTYVDTIGRRLVAALGAHVVVEADRFHGGPV